MGNNQIKITLKEIEEALPTFSRGQMIELDQKIHDYLETSLLTKASEKAFSEWEDPEEDIYCIDV